jgi:uncharacterized protein YecE (DUF72 family)
MIKTWKEQSPDGFLFAAKFPRMITHIRALRDSETNVDAFISKMSQLGSKLGPLLLQFPDSFGPKNLPTLKDFLSTLPKQYRYAVEIRNKKWIRDKLDSLLQENRVANVSTGNTDSDSTTSFVYLRLEGDRSKVVGTLGKQEMDRKADIQKLAAQIKTHLDSGIEIFVYFSKYFSGYPPSDAEQLLNLLQ